MLFCMYSNLEQPLGYAYGTLLFRKLIINLYLSYLLIRYINYLAWNFSSEHIRYFCVGKYGGSKETKVPRYYWDWCRKMRYPRPLSVFGATPFNPLEASLWSSFLWRKMALAAWMEIQVTMTAWKQWQQSYIFDCYLNILVENRVTPIRPKTYRPMSIRPNNGPFDQILFATTLFRVSGFSFAPWNNLFFLMRLRPRLGWQYQR